nr:tRNA (adenine(22)-N(1))-methyltransferase TrmK [Lacticaseibacillus sharpeae]
MVRQWLSTNDYGIVAETMLEDEGHVYTVMVAGRTKPDVPYTKADIEFGPILRKQRSAIFISELHRQQQALTRTLAGLQSARVTRTAKWRRLRLNSN